VIAKHVIPTESSLVQISEEIQLSSDEGYPLVRETKATIEVAGPHDVKGARMSTTFEKPRLETGTLLLADISGYTTFLGLVTAEHPEMIGSAGPIPPAYPIMSSLLDVVVDRIAPTFRLSEIEGDAVFGYAADDRLNCDGATVLQIIGSTYGGFRERIDEAMVHHHQHDCEACSILPTLDLKFLLHHGPPRCPADRRA
jgi:Protein of unknown function (DUF2652)